MQSSLWCRRLAKTEFILRATSYLPPTDKKLVTSLVQSNGSYNSKWSKKWMPTHHVENQKSKEWMVGWRWRWRWRWSSSLPAQSKWRYPMLMALMMRSLIDFFSILQTPSPSKGIVYPPLNDTAAISPSSLPPSLLSKKTQQNDYFSVVFSSTWWSKVWALYSHYSSSLVFSDGRRVSREAGSEVRCRLHIILGGPHFSHAKTIVDQSPR